MEINPNKCHFGGIFRSLQRYSHDRKKSLNHDPKCNSTVQQCVHSLTLFSNYSSPYCKPNTAAYKLRHYLHETKHYDTRANFFRDSVVLRFLYQRLQVMVQHFVLAGKKSNRNEIKKYHTIFFVSESILRKSAPPDKKSLNIERDL